MVEIGALATAQVLSVGPSRSLAEVARMMYQRKTGSAVVMNDDGSPGIITERDLLRAIAEGADLNTSPVENYMTANAITASPTWDVRKAARTMLDGGFRHLVILNEGGAVQGILSIRDLTSALL
jgi:CBS domain-containing protein